jgi:shikimate kinase/3-dehydroquinate synthase
MEASNLVFIGFMGAGKTSAARAAAGVLGVRAVDADHEIERRLGTTIEEHFSSHGEAAFRAVEEEVVCGLLERPAAPVVSLGGGAVTSERVRALLARHTVVLLDVDIETAWRRAGNKRRPLARDREGFVALHAQRRPLYDSLADAVLLDSSRDEVRKAVHALRSLSRAPAGTKLLWAAAASGSYPVYVGEGLVGSAFWPVPGRRFVITDEEVGARYRVKDATAEVSMPAGEEHKTLATVERLLRALAAAGMDHDDHVVALGGGVVGDVAGFCAAVYQRGVKVVQVPTTLVAQVDSAYGGKTGVDLPEGKNYAGAYHQPAAVMVDPSTMATLPQAELAAGWAEVIKTALIAGGPLWERVRGGTPLDRDLVLACARTKLAVVAGDERDAGRRQILNLGHTVGHAIETVTGYRRYRHGEAVGLGLLAALELSGQAALRAEVAALLDARGLPTTLHRDVEVGAVVAATRRDKKRRGGRLGFVLVESPGDVRPGRPVEEGELRRAVAELRAP